MEATRRLLRSTFDYDGTETETRANILAVDQDIPNDEDIEDEQDSVNEMLKTGLFDKLPEEYIILHGKEAFDKWISPFMRSVLKGHIDESMSYEHANECPEQRFCPSLVIPFYIEDRISGRKASIQHNEAYLAYPNEIIHMNITLIRELQDMGIFDEDKTETLIENYQWWLQSIDDVPITFDKTLFE